MNFVMKAAMGGEWSAGLEVDLTALQCKGFKGLFSSSSAVLALAPVVMRILIIHPAPNA